MPPSRIPCFRARPAAGHRTRYSWEPTAPLAKAGWPTVPIGMSDLMTEYEAGEKARAINAMVDDWRAGRLTEIPDLLISMKVLKRDRRPVAKRLAPPAAIKGTCGYLIAKYLESPEFTELLRDSTRRSYRPDIDLIREWCGDISVHSITPKLCKDLYNTLRRRAPTRAGKVVVVGRLLWKWGKGEDLVTTNPWVDTKVRAPARETPKLWTREAVRHFVAVADRLGEHGAATAVMLNSWLGQRKADVLAWDRRKLRDGVLALTQQKTGANVELPVGIVPQLMARLRADDARAAQRGIQSTFLIYDPRTGQPYTDSSMRVVFNRVRDAAVAGLPATDDGPALPAMPDMADLDMMHLRHTAVTALLDAGCNAERVRAITGHTLGSITQIMELYGLATRKQAGDAFRLRMTAEGMDGDDE